MVNLHLNLLIEFTLKFPSKGTIFYEELLRQVLKKITPASSVVILNSSFKTHKTVNLQFVFLLY